MAQLKVKLIDNEIRAFPLSRTDIKEDLLIEDNEYDLLAFEAYETNSELKIENGKLVINYNLEELKKEKKKELKQARQNYKKTVYLKEDYSIDKFEPLSCYNYYNLDKLKFGWTQADKDRFGRIVDYIGNKYNGYKKQIKEAKSKEELDKIQFTF